ncbi:glycosyltransferase involved in cell wall biosynthesis [Tamaricihabitans halophyticus]|uniref:Glycosyltransferase involved in cell wall biosynthesis n=1 Tax=Tamaricihabitans halophyticus TaxID=1262583 RepID=A0A4R2R1D9_9PSEU|nr:glycosyltransferase family A protein [Tamaricihabitans halophyticus]TCP56500.1 glycosyltransferase involved in cell wall biosynthesis [Tamaricihabitans halophyticus]
MTGQITRETAGGEETEHWPAVTAVVPTRDRPELVTRAVRSVLAQDYPGEIECIVVFDQSDPHEIAVPESAGRSLRVLSNERTPGLAGARNSGIIAASGEIIGHCDDDDEWLPGKLRSQLELWRTVPDAPVVATGLVVRGENGDHPRPAPARASFADFLGSRIMEIHSSNLLVRRADLLDRIGLVDEQLPNSFGEDYEWLLRAARYGDVHCVREPYAVINWNRPSFYEGRWLAMVAGLSYILDRYPEFASAPRGRARIEGQIAFAAAALGNRADAVRWAWRALRHDPRQLRALAALAVAARLVSPARLVRIVQSKGRGL